MIAIFGGVLIIGFPLAFLSDLTFVQNAVETEGVYVGIKSPAEFEDNRQVFIRFVDASGTERQETMRRSTATKDMVPGDRLPIVYDSRDPSSVCVDEFSEKWGATIAVAVFFSFGCVLSSFLYFFTKPDEFWSKQRTKAQSDSFTAKPHFSPCSICVGPWQEKQPHSGFA